MERTGKESLDNAKPSIKLASGHSANIECTNDGTYIRKKTNKHEFETYCNLLEDQKLETIIPKIHSMHKEDDDYYIEMENLVHNFKKPLVLDLKLGKWLYNELDEDYHKYTSKIDGILAADPVFLTQEELDNNRIWKIRKMQWRMNNTMLKTHDFFLNGFLNDGISEMYKQIYNYDKAKFEKFISDFFSKNTDAIIPIVDNIEEIHQILESSTFLDDNALLHTSILICVDGLNDQHVRVSLIDFAHSYKIPDINLEVMKQQKISILNGLKNISNFFKVVFEKNSIDHANIHLNEL